MSQVLYFPRIWTKGPARGPRRALVVDDDRDTVLTLTAILRDEGYETRGAYDGQSALAELTTFNPDVMIVDIAMPGTTGWDVAREVRRRHPRRPMLIAVSGSYVKAPDELLARAAGFNHYFVKPCDPRRLLQALGVVIP